MSIQPYQLEPEYSNEEIEEKGSDSDSNRKWAVFASNLSSRNQNYIDKYPFSVRDD